jgi:hypothetical protein
VPIPYACRTFRNIGQICCPRFRTMRISPLRAYRAKQPACACCFLRTRQPRGLPITLRLQSFSGYKATLIAKRLIPFSYPERFESVSLPGFQLRLVLPSRHLAPDRQLSLPTLCSPVYIFSFSNQSLSTFVDCDRPFFVWNCRPCRASELVFRPILLRLGCGSQPVFHASTPLRKLLL